MYAALTATAMNIETIIATLELIIAYVADEIQVVVNVITSNPLILFAVGLSLCGIVVHWFKMLFRA